MIRKPKSAKASSLPSGRVTNAHVASTNSHQASRGRFRLLTPAEFAAQSSRKALPLQRVGQPQAYRLLTPEQYTLRRAHVPAANSFRRNARLAPHRADYEFYPTPPEATRALLSVERFDGGIWEPACGEGHIAKVLETAGYDVVSTDLASCWGYGQGGCDFLQERSSLARHIITNPPYGNGLADAFVTHALELTGQTGGSVAMLLAIQSLAHPLRHSFWTGRPPAVIYALDRCQCWPYGDLHPVHIACRNVAELMGDHRVKLRRRQRTDQRCSQDDRRCLGSGANSECIGSGHDADIGSRQPYAACQFINTQPQLMVLSEELDAHFFLHQLPGACARPPTPAEPANAQEQGNAHGNIGAFPMAALNNSSMSSF